MKKIKVTELKFNEIEESRICECCGDENVALIRNEDGVLCCECLTCETQYVLQQHLEC